MLFQIKNLPPDMHRALKLRATQAGMSMSDYIVNELRRVLEVPSREEFLASLRSQSRVELPKGAATAVRAERDGR